MSRQMTKREELIWSVLQAGREQSTAAIMFHQAVADRLGLHTTDHKCADLLVLKGPMTAGELAVHTGLTTGAITGVIDRLEKGGFVERQDDPHDRRRVIVKVIPQRVKKIGRLFESLVASMQELCSRYTNEELKVILDFMTCTQAVAQQAMLKLRKG
jgi:DNA-binding MarR family transcriptional regulator